MVDYDVMVFVRIDERAIFGNDVDILHRDGDKTILITKKSWYETVRNNIISLKSGMPAEIQLIRTRHA